MSATRQKYVYIHTFGCQMNVHDSERMLAMLSPLGYGPTEEPKKATLILLNTCTIRDKAYHKAMSEIGRMCQIKAKRPDTLIGVCGCAAQEERESIFERYPDVDLIFGPDQISRLPDLIDETRKDGRAHALDLIDDAGSYRFLDASADSALRPSAFVSIMKGCNCACSYCIVPKVRGAEICREPQSILDEIKMLTKSGTKEVVLLGQNVNAYGNPRHASRSIPSFSNLLRMIARDTEISRIRFTSPHPRDVGDDLIEEYATNEKLMPHIHLPVQAGGNETLKRMRRGYTRERYIDVAKSLKTARLDISITTDIIVGFSGESREDFESTLDIMRRVEFDSAFAFKYSPRRGTEAAERFADDVPHEEKERRLSLVLALQGDTSRRKNEALIGKESPALATGLDRMKRGLITGRLPDNRIVHFAGNQSHLGNIVPLRISRAFANSLEGEVLL